MQTRLQNWLETALIRNFIIAVIIFNAVILGLETSTYVMARAGWLIGFLDVVCLAIFVIELIAKLIAYGRRFFTSGWNIFDFLGVLGKTIC